MTIGEDLYSYLVGDTAVNAIVSGRVEQNKNAQSETTPRIYFIRDSEEEDRELDGTRTGLVTTRFTIECIASEEDAAGAVGTSIALANEVKDALLDRGSNALGLSQATIRTIDVEDRDDDYAPLGIDSDEGLHAAALDVLIIHQV